MKASVIVAVIALQTTIRWAYSQNLVQTEDYDFVNCIPPDKPRDGATLQEYRQLKVITDLATDIPLRDIARRPLLDKNNADHNQFIACSWKKLEYLQKNKIMYDKIEMALRRAFIREVGGTGPGINLSKVEAQRIVDNCKNTTGITIGLKAMKVQICVHKQIQHL